MNIKQTIQQGRLAIAAFVLLVVAMLSGISPSKASAASAAYGSCQDLTIPVAMASGQPVNQTLAGSYCTPTSWATGPHTLDVLVAGATYNRTYWDWPVSPETYSYVDKDLQAGRAVFYYDRLGTGQSSHPNGTTVTLQADSYGLHQVIQHFKTVGGYTSLNVIGHSLGSMVAIDEAGTYNDMSKLVITSAVHLPGLGLGSSALVTQLYPAALDPQFSGSSTLLDGYLTTRPGGREAAFYGPHNTDPTVIAYDEAHKDLFSVGQDLTGLPTFDLPALLNNSHNITVPVLIVIGNEDRLFCGGLLDCTSATAIRNNEVPYYSSAASVSAISILATGHDIALHTTAPQSFAAINNWINQ